MGSCASDPPLAPPATSWWSAPAGYPDASCEHTLLSLNFVTALPGPQVDWDARIAELSIRNGSTGEVARDRSGVAQLLRLSLDSCKLLP